MHLQQALDELTRNPAKVIAFTDSPIPEKQQCMLLISVAPCGHLTCSYMEYHEGGKRGCHIHGTVTDIRDDVKLQDYLVGKELLVLHISSLLSYFGISQQEYDLFMSIPDFYN